MKILLQGYTGKSIVDGEMLLLTNYSLSMDENVIAASGAGKILTSNMMFRRFGLNAMRDYPSYRLSMSADVHFPFFMKMIQRIRGMLSVFMAVSFTDDATGIDYSFDQAILTSLSVSVPNNGTASMTMGFEMFRDEIEVNTGHDYDYHAIGHPHDNIIWDNLMPYWAWGVSYDDFHDDDLLSFDFTFEQPVTPHFGCEALDSDNAVGPMKVVMGVPKLTYRLEYLLAHATRTNDYAIPSPQIASDLAKTLDIRYHRNHVTFIDGAAQNKQDEVLIRFTNCYPDSYTPNLVGGNETVEVNGTVYGGVVIG